MVLQYEMDCEQSYHQMFLISKIRFKKYSIFSRKIVLYLFLNLYFWKRLSERKSIFMKKNLEGILFCFLLAVPAWFFGKQFPIIGGPVSAILLGMIIAFFPKKQSLQSGITFTSKKILQYAIILLGFDMNLFHILEVGQQSLLIIISTITTSLAVSYLISKALHIDTNTSVLVGVGSSICGGSAIAATAPVIEADNEEVARSISTIFLFNVIAAFIFPTIGMTLGMTDQGFGMWAGTAVNDTSSVVAAATTWSNMAGNDTALSLATIVKLTRTLAIIPITFCLALYRSKKQKMESSSFSIAKIFPWFILFFLFAAIINTILHLPSTTSKSLVMMGKFMITMAMAAIGLNTNLVKLIKNGAKPIFLGLCCWVSIAIVSILMQQLLHIW